MITGLNKAIREQAASPTLVEDPLIAARIIVQPYLPGGATIHVHPRLLVRTPIHHPKRQLNIFSRFCTADATFSPICYTAQLHFLQMCPLSGEIWTPPQLIHRSLSPPDPQPQTTSRSPLSRFSTIYARCRPQHHDHNTDTDTDILARILADTSDTRDFQKLFLRQAERYADILATILARMSVSASWNAGFTLYLTQRERRSLTTTAIALT